MNASGPRVLRAVFDAELELALAALAAVALLKTGFTEVIEFPFECGI
jgi:hypothetical protein